MSACSSPSTSLGAGFGERVARRDSSANVFYYFEDELGSSRIITNATGTVCYDADLYPFGAEQYVYTNNCPQNYKFTGKERDAETGLDEFGARYYSSALGRFTIPDWAAKPTAVPYAKFGDPQTLNLYSYVENSPVNRADADGHDAALAEDLEVVADEAAKEVGSTGGRPISMSGTLAIGAAVIGLELNLLIHSEATIIQSKADLDRIAVENHNEELAHNEDEAGQPKADASGAGARKGGGNVGTIYRVPGSATESGKPYIGRHNQEDPAKTRRSNDGRDRSKAKVVDKYDAANTQEGRTKEQQQIDKRGLQNLDNKRNEIKKDKTPND